MKVPSFLLRRLYVKGSLRNTDGGWQFLLRNSIAAGEAIGLEPLIVDGMPVAADSCFFHLDGIPVAFSSVDADNRFGLDAGRDILVSVAGAVLAPGTHAVVMAFSVPALGRLELAFTDDVS